MKLDPYLIPYIKINSKLLEENIREKLHDFGFDNDFFDMIPNAGATKEKLDKLDFVKIKNFCVSKDTNNRVKRLTTEWEKNICKSCLQ